MFESLEMSQRQIKMGRLIVKELQELMKQRSKVKTKRGKLS